MLRFEMDVSAADLQSRTIEGVLVPYGEVATIEGRKVRFRPGSVKLARSRTPLLIDHDRQRPVGVLAETFTNDDGLLLGRFRIDETAEGDVALIQAASGSRGAFSVGAEVEGREHAGILDVEDAEVVEVSLLALGAFEGATVTRVAANADDPAKAQLEEGGSEEGDDDDDRQGEGAEAPDPNPDQLEIADDEPAAAEGEGEAPAESEPDPENAERERTQLMTEASAPTPVILAERGPDPARLGAGELVSLFVRAQHGEHDARRYVEAALTESPAANLTGLLPPQYEREVIGGKVIPRPLYNAFRSRPLPGVGLAINKPKWTTRPDGAWASAIDADATSSPVVIGSQAADVERWDWAGAIPWVVVQRSDPSIVDEIYAEAVQDFYSDVEEKVAAELAAAPTNLAATLGAGIAAFFDENDQAPEIIIVAPDVWGDMADTGQLQNPTAAGAVSTDGILSSTFAGIPITSSGKLAAGARYLATRRAIDARVTEPVRLTANAIGALNVELAVVGEGLFDTDWPDEIMELTPGAATTTAAASKSKS